MADVTYDVMVRFLSGGNIGAHLGQAQAHASHLQRSMAEVGEVVGEWGRGLVEHFQEAVEHAGHLVGHLAKIGLAAGVAGAAYGVGHLNAQLESTQISLAAIFKAQGFSRNFNEAFATAGDQVSKMTQDIKKLPGDLGQLSNVMLQLASPLATAGKNPDEIRRIAGKTMLASQILLGAKYGSAAQEIGAREMAMLLQGNFGSRNTWAMELPGMQQYKSRWKGMSEEQRLKAISERVDNLVESTRAKFETSWAAVWTTFRDDMKYSLLAPATLPLFNRVKGTLQDIHAWFEKNEARVKDFTDRLGKGLADAWTRGIEAAQSWWPQILSFAQGLRAELEVVWMKFGPTLKEVAGSLRTALGDGSAVKDIKEVLKLYVASKAAGVPMGMAGGALKIGASFAQIAAAGGGGGGGLVEGLGGAGVLAGGAAALAALTIAAGGAAGELHALADSTSKYHEDAVLAAGGLHQAWKQLVDQFDVNIMPSLEKFGVGLTRAAAWMLSDQAGGQGGWLDQLRQFVDPTMNQEEPMLNLADSIWNLSSTVKQYGTEFQRNNTNVERHFGGVAVHTAAQGIAQAYKEMYAAKKGGGHGGGGTSIQKVEIVVSSTQDAGRVAELVRDKLVNIHRHPKVSPNVPNFAMR